MESRLEHAERCVIVSRYRDRCIVRQSRLIRPNEEAMLRYARRKNVSREVLDLFSKFMPRPPKLPPRRKRGCIPSFAPFFDHSITYGTKDVAKIRPPLARYRPRNQPPKHRAFDPIYPI